MLLRLALMVALSLPLLSAQDVLDPLRRAEREIAAVQAEIVAIGTSFPNVMFMGGMTNGLRDRAVGMMALATESPQGARSPGLRLLCLYASGSLPMEIKMLMVERANAESPAVVATLDKLIALARGVQEFSDGIVRLHQP